MAEEDHRGARGEYVDLNQIKNNNYFLKGEVARTEKSETDRD